MKLYKAVINRVQTYLQDSSQMDEYLEKGCSIYEEEDGKETLIATPYAWYSERPVFGPDKPINTETYSRELIEKFMALLKEGGSDGADRDVS